MSEATLCTVGYRGRSFSAFADLLGECGIGALIDVRYAAETRNKTFAKSTLRTKLPERGIRYEHVRALGNRNYRGGPMQIVDLDAGLAEVERVLAEHRTVVLMCACRTVDGCHRAPIAAALGERAPDIEIVHL